MRRRAHAPGIALAMSLLLAPACGDDDAADEASRDFVSPVYDYTVTLPAGWDGLPATRELDEREPPHTAGDLPATDVLAPQPNRTVRDMELPALVIGAQRVPPTTSLEEWTTTVTEIVAEQKGCDAPAERRPTSIDGHAAVTLVYPRCPEGLHLFHLWTAVVVGDRAYHLVWFDDVDHLDGGLDQLEDVLATLAFT